MTLNAWDVAPFVGVLVGAAIGFFSSVFAEPLRRWLFRPRVCLSFDDDEHCHVTTPAWFGPAQEHETEACYLRVRVRNTSRYLASGCRVFLAAIATRETDVKPWKLRFGDYLSLPLAYGDAAPIDIPPGATLYSDLLRSYKNRAVMEVCSTVVPAMFAKILNEQTTYRFTVLVAGQNIDVAQVSVCVNWKGDWTVPHPWEDLG